MIQAELVNNEKNMRERIVSTKKVLTPKKIDPKTTESLKINNFSTVIIDAISYL